MFSPLDSVLSAVYDSVEDRQSAYRRLTAVLLCYHTRNYVSLQEPLPRRVKLVIHSCTVFLQEHVMCELCVSDVWAMCERWVSDV